MSIQILRSRINRDDIPEITAWVEEMWGGNPIVVHLDTYKLDKLPGFKAQMDDELVGFLHYEIRDDGCETLTLVSMREGRGVESALIQAVEDLARAHGCRRPHLITTNDNLHALGFYPCLGFHLSRLFPGCVAQSRQMKPSIPLVGDGGIPIRAEIQLEKILLEGNSEETR
ncbi:MAG: GNAT family N-acetyltransferase [Chloroflexota bacterium]|nr:GNAT family N-acetyltransferase [Chloroflexota bacterium]